VPTTSLPDHPDLAQLKRQARELQRDHTAGSPGAIAEVEAHLPDRRSSRSLKLAEAQTVIARRYGFSGWQRLREFLDGGGRPDLVEALDDPGDEVLRLACLTYGDDDGRHRWDGAAELLAADPSLATRTPALAAATGSIDSLRRFVDADRVAALRRSGPFGWTPPLYACASRIGTGEHAVDVVRLLLDAGADPNETLRWDGRYPFTALTFVFGEGEQGPARQPRHPRWVELATVLLDAGADSNDSQVLYDRMFTRDDDSHLVLLFDHGMSPTFDALAGQVRWARPHQLEHRLRLLEERGVDIGPAPELDEIGAAIESALRGDRAALEACLPATIAGAQARRPALISWAVANGRRDAAELLLDLGWDVNALGRTDVVNDERWHTALHMAVHDPSMVELLLERGADPTIRDARFDATPLGWARHGEHAEAIAILEPLTAPVEADASGEDSEP
jgi:hypothetical protein